MAMLAEAVRAVRPLPYPGLAPVPAAPADLPAYATLRAELDPEMGILWARMLHPERACFTPELMADGRHFQAWLRDEFSGLPREAMPFRYLAWSSQAQGAWSMGGDLATFTRMIRSQDVEALRAYAYGSVDVLYDNYRALDLPIMTVALIQGDAIGGGFEAMLTNDIVVAERGAKFGLPEVLFNLFPGMGAFSFLRRKVGAGLARSLVEDGLTRTADELHAMGLIDVVCEPGQGKAALHRHLAGRRFATRLAMAQARRRADLLKRAELTDIVDLWVELALGLGESELRRMEALGRHQQRLRARG